jgi:hypothetical protein
MKVPQILCALLLCTASAWEAPAVASPERGGSVTEPDSANTDGPKEAKPSPARQTGRSRAATGEDMSTKAGRTNERRSPPVGSDKSVGSTGRNPGAAASRGRDSAALQRGMGQLARPNADRLRSLLSAQARGRPTRQPSRRPGGPIRAATDGAAAARGLGGAGQAFRPTHAASRTAAVASRPTAVASRPMGVASGPAPVGSDIAARRVTSPSAVTRALGRGSTSGGPRAPGPGLVGGPAIGRTAHNATIDGAQLRHQH